MRTKAKTFVGMAACAALLVSAASAQESSPSGRSALDETLCRSVCERVQPPVVFSTRDTVFALSLPADEPAEIYVQLTVGKNGKVKEKLTRVNANHIGGYVAPAFLAATKDLKIDKSLLAGMQGKDTSLILTFPLEYQCVYDTISKEWPSAVERLNGMSRIINTEAYPEMYRYNGHRPMTNNDIEEARRFQSIISMSSVDSEYRNTALTTIWYYLAFIKGQQE